MSAGVVATPTYQGVTKLPTAAHLRTNLSNGNVRVSSQTNSVGGQPAFYEITGGSITNNVKLSLPAISSDDTLVTQNDNVTWGGGHLFTNGLNATGPIVTNSSLSGQSISAGNLTVNSALNSGGSITAGDTLTAKNHVIAGQKIQSGSDGTIGGNLSAAASAFNVDTTKLTHTGTGANALTGSLRAATNFFTDSTQITHSAGNFATNSSGIQHQGGINLFTASSTNWSVGSTTVNHTLNSYTMGPTALGYGSGTHLSLFNNLSSVSDNDFFSINFGTTKGIIFGRTTSNKFGFYNTGGVNQAAGGVRTAGASWTSNEQYMLGQAYGQMRLLGLLSP